MFKTKQLFFQLIALLFFLATVYLLSINFTQPVVYQMMPNKFMDGMLGIPMVVVMTLFAIAVYSNRMAYSVTIDKARHHAERQVEKINIELTDSRREHDTLLQKIGALESALEKSLSTASSAPLSSPSNPPSVSE